MLNYVLYWAKWLMSLCKNVSSTNNEWFGLQVMIIHFNRIPLMSPCFEQLTIFMHMVFSLNRFSLNPNHIHLIICNTSWFSWIQTLWNHHNNSHRKNHKGSFKTHKWMMQSSWVGLVTIVSFSKNWFYLTKFVKVSWISNTFDAFNSHATWFLVTMAI